MAIAQQDVTPFLDAYRTLSSATEEPAWLTARRDAGMKRFGEIGFPTRKQENWRFTDLRPLTLAPILPSAAQGGFDPGRLDSYYFGGPSHRIVLINGLYAPELSNIGRLPDGALFCSTAEALNLRPELVESAFDTSESTGAQPFASLNAGFFSGGFVLALDPGTVLEAPVEIVHFGDAPEARAFHLRNIVSGAAGSKAAIVETFAGAGFGWTNTVTALHLGAGAEIRHVKIQGEAADAIHLSLTRGTLAKAARYETFILSLGARLSRQDLHISSAGEAANVAINGAYLLRGEQEATFAPFVDHQAPGCQTNEVFKGVIQDRAHGVFLGKMTVRPGADQTDAHQLNQNLLLSPQASVDTKPELEIFADEVRCSHGATVGDLDENTLFYLQARGIEPAAARHMLVEAFAASAIEGAGLGQDLTSRLLNNVRGWLDKAGMALKTE